MTQDQARQFFQHVTRDWQKGEVRKDRFAMGFSGNIVNQLIGDMDKFNYWTKRIWTDAPVDLDSFWEEPLLGAGSSYPTLLLYLRNPEQNNIWMKALEQGLQFLGFPSEKWTLSAARYQSYNRVVSELKERHGWRPQEVDVILIRLGRLLNDMAAEIEAAIKDAGLVATGTKIINRINPKYSLSFDIQLVTRDVPIQWLAGSRRRSDGGFVIHALVGNRQSDRKALKDALQPFGYDWLCDGADPETNSEFFDYHSSQCKPDSAEHAVLGTIPFGSLTTRSLRDLLSPFLVNLQSVLTPVGPDEGLKKGDEESGEFVERYTLEDASAATYLPVDYLEELLGLMETAGRRQIILYGPPGTGKTWVAGALAKVLTGGQESRIESVQFHPSYEYEDFIEGLRPQTVESAGRKDISYEVEDGIFKRFCARAAEEPTKKFVMIVDEINRGNIPRIFGELLSLLEYRGGVRTLPYSKQPFSIPGNVYLIGTMNTADRSIALVDYALRRRFYFVPFYPDTQAGILRQWLEDHRPSMVFVADMLDKVNEEIGDRSVYIGHSYFMDPDLDRKRLELVWTYSVWPLLEELFFDRPTKLEGLKFERLWRTYAPRDGQRDDGQLR
ncbi:MAG: McrB family protein [Symbiobacteriia bacterium]